MATVECKLADLAEPHESSNLEDERRDHPAQGREIPGVEQRPLVAVLVALGGHGHHAGDVEQHEDVSS